MKPIIISYAGPVFVDALIRSMYLFYPEFKSPSIVQCTYNDAGYDKLRGLHDIDYYPHNVNIIDILDLESTLVDELLILSDTSIFIRPFNIHNNKLIKRFRSDNTILTYYLGMDMDMYDSPPSNIFNFRNELDRFRYLTITSSIFKSEDMLYFINNGLNDKTIFSLIDSFGIANNKNNRIVDYKRTVLNYYLSKDNINKYNEDFLKGKMIEFDEYFYFETPERCQQLEKLNLIWRE